VCGCDQVFLRYLLCLEAQVIRGVHRSRTGPDRTGLDRRPNKTILETKDRTDL